MGKKDLPEGLTLGLACLNVGLLGYKIYAVVNPKPQNLNPEP